jgi:hypothetical protein
LNRSAIPELKAAEKANPYLNTYVVSYHNGRKTSFPWAAINERLDHGLRYVPGTAITPPGSKLMTSIDSEHVQTLTLVLPHGIPSGARGSFAFQTRYRWAWA